MGGDLVGLQRIIEEENREAERERDMFLSLKRHDSYRTGYDSFLRTYYSIIQTLSRVPTSS